MIAPTKDVMVKTLARDVARCCLCNTAQSLGFSQRVEVDRGARQPGAVEGVTLCRDCVLDIRSDPHRLVIARAFGVRIPRLVDPQRVPLYYAHEFTWCRLKGVRRMPITHKVAIDLMASVYGRAHRAWWQEATGS